MKFESWKTVNFKNPERWSTNGIRYHGLWKTFSDQIEVLWLCFLGLASLLSNYFEIVGLWGMLLFFKIYPEFLKKICFITFWLGGCGSPQLVSPQVSIEGLSCFYGEGILLLKLFSFSSDFQTLCYWLLYTSKSSSIFLFISAAFLLFQIPLYLSKAKVTVFINEQGCFKLGTPSVDLCQNLIAKIKIKLMTCMKTLWQNFEQIPFNKPNLWRFCYAASSQWKL